MENTQTQADINKAEWDNGDNWGGPKWLSVYFSKRDTRIWVPQQPPSKGRTVNLAHTGGLMWMIGICIGVIVLIIGLSFVALGKMGFFS